MGKGQHGCRGATGISQATLDPALVEEARDILEQGQALPSEMLDEMSDYASLQEGRDLTFLLGARGDMSDLPQLALAYTFVCSARRSEHPRWKRDNMLAAVRAIREKLGGPVIGKDRIRQWLLDAGYNPPFIGATRGQKPTGGAPHDNQRETGPVVVVDIRESTEMVKQTEEDLKHWSEAGRRTKDAFASDLANLAPLLLDKLDQRGWEEHQAFCSSEPVAQLDRAAAVAYSSCTTTNFNPPDGERPSDAEMILQQITQSYGFQVAENIEKSIWRVNNHNGSLTGDDHESITHKALARLMGQGPFQVGDYTLTLLPVVNEIDPTDIQIRVERHGVKLGMLTWQDKANKSSLQDIASSSEQVAICSAAVSGDPSRIPKEALRRLEAHLFSMNYETLYYQDPLTGGRIIVERPGESNWVEEHRFHINPNTKRKVKSQYLKAGRAYKSQYETNGGKGPLLYAFTTQDSETDATLKHSGKEGSDTVYLSDPGSKTQVIDVKTRMLSGVAAAVLADRGLTQADARDMLRRQQQNRHPDAPPGHMNALKTLVGFLGSD